MHLIDKDPMPVKNALDIAIKKKTQETRNKYISNPILRMASPLKEKTKPREVQIRTVSSPKPQRMRQYGDKGYVPSNGKGVSY